MLSYPVGGFKQLSHFSYTRTHFHCPAVSVEFDCTTAIKVAEGVCGTRSIPFGYSSFAAKERTSATAHDYAGSHALRKRSSNWFLCANHASAKHATNGSASKSALRGASGNIDYGLKRCANCATKPRPDFFAYGFTQRTARTSNNPTRKTTCLF
jgi:hypothetical protein